MNIRKLRSSISTAFFIGLMQVASAQEIIDYETVEGRRTAPGGYGWDYSYDIGYFDDAIQVDLDVKLIGLYVPDDLLNSWEDGFEDIWSVSADRFGVPINFNLDWVYTGEDLVVNAIPTGRSNLANWAVDNWYPEGLSAHELGHQMGLYDEYVGGANDADNPQRLNSGGLMDTLTGPTLDYYYDTFLDWHELNVLGAGSGTGTGNGSGNGTGTGTVVPNRTLVIGDALSEEYAVQASFASPANNQGDEASNWLELLAAYRSDDFDFGSLKPASGGTSWNDYRTKGYRYNFSFPERSTQLAVDKMGVTTSQDLESWRANQAMNNALENYIDRVVIFLGAKDARNYYRDIYYGNEGQLKAFGKEVVRNLRIIVDEVQEKNPDLEIVLVNIPDLGATPQQRSESSDPVKREDYSEGLKEINDRIEALAERKGIAVADIYSVSRDIMKGEPHFLGGHRLSAKGHFNNDPLHLYCRDNIQPNTVLQALYARAIIAAFNETYQEGIATISDQEITEWLDLEEVEYPYWRHIPVHGWAKLFSGTVARSNFLGRISSLESDLVQGWFYSDRWKTAMVVDGYEKAIYTNHHDWVWLDLENAPAGGSSDSWAYSTRLLWVYAEDSIDGWVYSMTHGWLYVAQDSDPGMYYSADHGWVYIETDASVYSFSSGSWL